MTRIDAGVCVLRPWREGDAQALVRIADDADVARYMADQFPHPYTDADAAAWLGGLCRQGVHFAVDVDGQLAGGVGGYAQGSERRFGMAFGYWLGREFWGRGIASAATGAFVKHVFETTDFVRLEAAVYAPNVASMRVLEKCGFQREGVMRRAIFKNGEMLDAVIYARVRA